MAAQEHGGLSWAEADGGCVGGDLHQILAAYRRRQFQDHVAGPTTSLLVHLVILLLLSVWVVAKAPRRDEPVAFSTVELKVKEPPPLPKPDVTPPEELEGPEQPDFAAPDAPDANRQEASLEDLSDVAPETADEVDAEQILAVVPRQTALRLPLAYGGRTPSGRSKRGKERGMEPGSEQAVLRALRWLARVQRQNGSWEDDPAHTGLALLCFLAHGETPLSETYGLTVQRGLAWLAAGMPTTGPWKRAYSHGIATYALAEAYGMPRIPFLRDPLERGVTVIIRGQQPKGLLAMRQRPLRRRRGRQARARHHSLLPAVGGLLQSAAHLQTGDAAFSRGPRAGAR